VRWWIMSRKFVILTILHCHKLSEFIPPLFVSLKHLNTNCLVCFWRTWCLLYWSFLFKNYNETLLKQIINYLKQTIYVSHTHTHTHAHAHTHAHTCTHTHTHTHTKRIHTVVRVTFHSNSNRTDCFTVSAVNPKWHQIM
jgi:hypothetical protein